MAGVTRVGATKQYSDNWDKIFGGKRRTSGVTTKSTKPTRQSAKKKAPKKNRAAKAAKKASRRK